MQTRKMPADPNLKAKKVQQHFLRDDLASNVPLLVKQCNQRRPSLKAKEWAAFPKAQAQNRLRRDTSRARTWRITKHNWHQVCNNSNDLVQPLCKHLWTIRSQARAHLHKLSRAGSHPSASCYKSSLIIIKARARARALQAWLALATLHYQLNQSSREARNPTILLLSHSIRL